MLPMQIISLEIAPYNIIENGGIKLHNMTLILATDQII